MTEWTKAIVAPRLSLACLFTSALAGAMWAHGLVAAAIAVFIVLNAVAVLAHAEFRARDIERRIDAARSEIEAGGRTTGERFKL